ncbi:MAG: sterol desaturase family protein [Actinomycetota bacterium]|jgi:sterol desaturase/sphingolipid hydroxylase (fatty acid hydroxylase superfamily)|nr:sterol desaturase family protein [Actinomycetota bacterium]
MVALTVVAAVIVGSALWTLTEYAMHRFGFHHRGEGSLFKIIATEHTRHHRAPSATNFLLRLAGHAGVALLGLPIGIFIAAFTSRAFGTTLWATWALGYTVYEVGHWRLHHRPPHTPAALRRRVRHMSHHGANAGSNFGVSVDVWDRVFSTAAPSGPVELAEVVAPQWLLDDPSAYEPLVVRGSRQTSG